MEQARVLEITERQIDRLVLGSAQIGMCYGINNRIGKPKQYEAEKLIIGAWNQGIREFDTAKAYGTSESIIGSTLNKLGLSQKARIISKPNSTTNHLDSLALQRELDDSLEKLKIPSLHGWMIHDETLLDFWEHGLGDNLLGFKAKGLIKNIGFSVYSPQRALQTLDCNGVSILQIPSNILDRRFEGIGLFSKAKRKGVQIYIRSIFLQGLLLMDYESLPRSLYHHAKPILRKIDMFTEEFRITRTELMISYVKLAYPQAKIVFGAEMLEQIKNSVDAMKADYPYDLVTNIHSIFKSIDDKILNPSLW